MQCEGSVRDLIRLAALAPVNLAVRPDRLGMEAGAPSRPTADEAVLAAAVGEKQREPIPWLRVTDAETARHPLGARAVSILPYFVLLLDRLSHMLAATKRC